MEDFRARLEGCLVELDRARQARAVARTLAQLDDRLLADIGLGRDAVSGALRLLPESLSSAPVRLRR